MMKMKNELLSDLMRRCLDADYIHTENDGDYAIEFDGNIVYILFQWSHSDLDWFSNFNFPAKAYKNGDSEWYAHRGFLRVWKTLRDYIEPAIYDLTQTHAARRIICVGYSHGAALAGFCTEDLMYLYGEKIEVRGYGFGCPRFVWGKLPKAVKERFKAFTPVRNIPDIVTHVPPALFGFSHAGKLLKVGKLGRHNPVKAHYPDIYIKELARHGNSSELDV